MWNVYRLAGVLFALLAIPAEAARLENPASGQFYSGIGVISGWKCNARGPLTIRIDEGPPVPLVYGSERRDTRRVCGDTDNGFVTLWNWALLESGRHTARAYDNGVLFARATFEVGTLGTEFLRGYDTRREPNIGTSYGENLALRWNENTQHFEILGIWEHAKESRSQYQARLDRYQAQIERGSPAWHAQEAQLENPGHSQLYSGLGVVSGWKCDVEGPLTIRFNGGQPVPLIYGSERADTDPICGDTANGFVALWNWALLGEGVHTARVYDNGVLFAETRFQVGTAGVERWAGKSCDPTEPGRCISYGPFAVSFQVDSKIGYDGQFWSDRPHGAEPLNTYFRWNIHTQHFEAVKQRRYQPFDPPEPPVSWRWQSPNFVDRPDDFSGPQIHLYLAQPLDAQRRYDTIGYLSAAVQDGQRWLAARTHRGRAFRIDTYQGRPDVTTLLLNRTTADMQELNFPETIFDTPILRDGSTLADLGYRDTNKLHYVFINAPPALTSADGSPGNGPCGVAAPIDGVAVTFSGRPFLPEHGNAFCGRETLIFLHEVFHLLGAVDPEAPHEDGTSHIELVSFGEDEGSFDEDGNRLGYDDELPKRKDLMQPGAGYTYDGELDIGSDDYYFHPDKRPTRSAPHYDTSDSPFFTRGPWRDRTRVVLADTHDPYQVNLSSIEDLPPFHDLEPTEGPWCLGPWLGTER